MKAVIMVGVRNQVEAFNLRDSKPMVPILNKPSYGIYYRALEKHEITYAVTLAYFPKVVTDYFGNGSNWGVNLDYYTEIKPLVLEA